MSVNKQIILGNLGKDAEVTHLEGGNTVARFTVATTESYKNKAGEQVKDTQWHNVTAWGKLAEYCEKYIKKGLMVYVEGKTTHGEYTDKDGNTRKKCEIVADTIKNLTWPADPTKDAQGPQNTPQNDSRGPQNQNDLPPGDIHGDGDDLPF